MRLANVIGWDSLDRVLIVVTVAIIGLINTRSKSPAFWEQRSAFIRRKLIASLSGSHGGFIYLFALPASDGRIRAYHVRNV